MTPLRSRLARRERSAVPAGLVLSFTLLGLLLRLFRLDFQPLWWDEGYSAWFATHPLVEMLRLTAEDIHPPLYYALLHVWTLVAGAGPVSLRLVSVAAGVAAIPLMYVAATGILGSRRAGLLAAFLVAINPLQVYYSQEVRMYGLVALLSLGVLWAAWRTLHVPSSRLGAPAVYVILTTLALYTQYYAIFLPIGLTVYALWFLRGDPKRLLRWLGLQVIVALLYLPWVIYAGPRLTLYVSQKVVMDADKPLGLLAYFGRHLSAFAAGHLEGTLTPWWPLALLLLVPVVVGLALAARGHASEHGGAEAGADEHNRPDMNVRAIELSPTSDASPPQPVAFLGVVLFVALFAGWLIGLRYPFFPDRGERLLLLALPTFIMLAAAGIDGLIWGRRSGRMSRGPKTAGYVALALFVVAAVVSLVAFYTIPRYEADDYRPLIARSVEQGLPGDTLFAVYPWQAGYWRSYAGTADGPEAILTPSAEWGADVQAALDEALRQGRVWFPAHLALGAILETQIEAYLSSRAIPFANTWYGPGTRLSAWHSAAPAVVAEPPVAAGPLVAYDLPGRDQLELVAAPAPSQPVPAANGIAPLALSWRAGAAPPELSASVRMVDDLGQIWAQNDYEPLGGMAGPAGGTSDGGGWQATDRLGLLVPAGTPPGRYHVELVVLPKDSERVLAGRVQSGELKSSVPLFEVEVSPADRSLTPDRLPITVRQTVDLGDGVRFLGYTVDRAPLAPGAGRRVNLFWQATGHPSADYTAFVQLLGKDGAPVAAWEAAPGAAYPTSSWTPGALIRTQAFLRPGAEIADGRYPLITGMYRPADGVRLKTAEGRDSLDLGALTVKGRSHEMTAEGVVPASATPVAATFGDVARLVAFDSSPEQERDGTESLTLYWQAMGATQSPYTVFVHLVDEETDAVIGYGDGEPANGANPTTGWLSGEYLSDSHTIVFPAGPAEGRRARIEIGLYDPATGQRLALPDGSDSFVLWRGQVGG